MGNRKGILILVGAVVLIICLCVVLEFRERRNGEQSKETQIVTEATAQQEESISDEEEKSIKVEEDIDDEGFGELIPLN